MHRTDQLASDIQERDARHAHEEFQIAGGEKVDVRRSDVHRDRSERLISIDVEQCALGMHERRKRGDVLRRPVEIVAVRRRDDRVRSSTRRSYVERDGAVATGTTTPLLRAVPEPTTWPMVGNSASVTTTFAVS
jgi:hypothetical protein